MTGKRIVSATTVKKPKVKSKEMSELMKFPTMSQMRADDRNEGEDARAVALENQYLKN